MRIAEVKHGTGIEWTHIPGTTGSRWNPLVGCSMVSPGCTHCYAMTMARRIAAAADARAASGAALSDRQAAYRRAVKRGPGGKPLPLWSGEVSPIESALTEPLRWRSPRTMFVNSMSDLFHESVPFEFVDRVYAVMALCPQHTFIVLTKRAGRMREYFAQTRLCHEMQIFRHAKKMARDRVGEGRVVYGISVTFPVCNVWLGVSVENQEQADARIPHLLATPAAVRFLSCEPLIGALDLSGALAVTDRHGEPSGPRCKPDGSPAIDWVIVGGESGPGAREFDPLWGREIVEQCMAAGVPVFVKQFGSNVVTANFNALDWPDGTDTEADGRHVASCRVLLRDRKGGQPSEWPEGLRVRAFPHGVVHH